ncbi:MAG: Rpp14/Pop5 family protein [Candidatus Micrarchaeaceae archaeon]
MMRPKHRYLLVESLTNIGDSERPTFEFRLYKELLHCLGEISYHKANPKIMRFTDRNRFIMKCELVGYEQLILGLTFIKKLDGKDSAFYTINASGTIKALTKK